MEDKKDIGELIEQRLSDADVPLENGLWDRIEGSLEDRDRRKRNILLLWLSGGAVAILLFLLLLNAMGNSDLDPEDAIENEELLVTQIDSILQTSELNSEKTITYKDIESFVKDSIGEDNVTQGEGQNLSTTGKKTNPDNLGEPGDTRNRKVFTGEGVTIKTVYHYYNSATNEVFETTDKQVIDSLIDNGNKETDSIQVIETRIQTMKKKDSLS